MMAAWRIFDQISYPVNILRRREVEGENAATEAEQENFTQHIVSLCHRQLVLSATGGLLPGFRLLAWWLWLLGGGL